jgi:two-component system response regulator NreC
MPRIRILVVDDHAIMRTGLRMLLEAQSDIEVVGEAGDGSEASRQAKVLQPDIVLMDLSMPGPRSGDAIRGVLRASPKTRVLILTMHDDPAYLASAMSAGASGYVVKKVADTELLLAIRAVNAGRTFVDFTQTSTVTRAVGKGTGKQRQPKALGRREVEVLRLLAQGFSNQEIADRFHVSVKTVETHRTRLREKLGLKARADMYRYALESGILDADFPGPRR